MGGMYTVGARDHIMIAHSLKGEVFGPAQSLHGATYAVTVEIEREELNAHDIVIDIGLLRERLREVLADLEYRNLDEHPAFKDHRSTTEAIARYIHRELARRLESPAGLMTVTLDESPVAFAKYRAPCRFASIPPPRDA